MNDSLKKIDKISFENIKENLKNTADGVKDVLTQSIESRTGLTGLEDKLAQIVPSGKFLAVSTAIGAIGIASVNSASQIEVAMRRFQVQTGIANNELGLYEELMLSIYRGNYGESIEDVADSMGKVKQQFDNLDTNEFQDIVENALTLRDTFDMDVNETLRGTKQLMEQFGISGSEAMDLIASGAQNGLNYTDELGDNIAEYAGKFAQAGYSSEEYFQLLKNGTEGGAYNLDKINDAINEVTTRLADGTIEENLELFSSRTANVFNAWKEGKATQKEVINSIINDISSCTNEQEKLTMAATAFGTMGEDSNAKFVESLLPVGDTFKDIEGTMNDVKETASSGLGASLESLKRSFETLLVPLRELFIPVLVKIIDFLSWIISLISDVISIVAGWVINWEESLAFLQELWDTFAQWFDEGVKAVVDGFTKDLQGLLDWFVNTFGPILVDIFKMVSNIFGGMVNGVLGYAKTWLNGIKNIINNIMGIFNGIITFIKGVFTGNWKQAWNGVKQIFSNIVSGFVNIIKTPINTMIDLVNGFIGGLNNIKIPDWVPLVGGKGLSIPTIPKLERGGILKKGQVGLLEGNGAEAVVPLDRNKAWIRAVAKDMAFIMPESTRNSYNQTNNFYTPVETPDKVARALRLQQRYGLAGAK